MVKWKLIGELPNVDNIPETQEKEFSNSVELLKFLSGPNLDGHFHDGYSPLVLIPSDEDGEFSYDAEKVKAVILR